MNKFLLNFCSCLFLIVAIHSNGMAQGACTQVLNQAQDKFEAGHLYEIPSLLKNCLDNGFTQQEKIQAYWLLTQTYLIIDDPISAENSYMELLKRDPEYVIDEANDPIEIVYLSKKFTTNPIFEFTLLKAGINFSNPTIIHQYGVYNTSNYTEEYKWGTGLQLGPAVDFNINKNFGVSLELLFSTKSYKSVANFFANDSISDGLNFSENQSWLDMPLYVRYERQYGQWYPYVYGGYSVNMLLNARVNSTFTDEETAGTRTSEINGLQVGAQRNRFNTSFVAGIGTRYRLGYRYLSLEVRYTGGLTNVLKPEEQFSQDADGSYNTDLLFRNPRIDSDFRMNSISVMVGYVWPKYKPRKLATGNKGVLKLFNKKQAVGNEKG